MLIANQHPKLKLVVQDLPAIGPAFEGNVPSDLTSRVAFQAHDFFTPQTVRADAYLIKSVLHN